VHPHAEEAKGLLLVRIHPPSYRFGRSLFSFRFSVPHDRLFLDALERDLKRERMGQEPTTTVMGEPALSFTYDPKRPLYEQFSAARDGEGELETAVRLADERSQAQPQSHEDPPSVLPELDYEHSTDESVVVDPHQQRRVPGTGKPLFSMLSLFEGSPTYKQRRKKAPRPSRKFSPLLTNEQRVIHGHGVGKREKESVDMGAGYGASDGDLSAADMFLAQAREEFGPERARQRERERERERERAKRKAPPALTGLGEVPYMRGMNGPSSAPTSLGQSSFQPHTRPLYHMPLSCAR
jgi:transcription factor STE12